MLIHRGHDRPAVSATRAQSFCHRLSGGRSVVPASRSSADVRVTCTRSFAVAVACRIHGGDTCHPIVPTHAEKALASWREGASALSARYHEKAPSPDTVRGLCLGFRWSSPQRGASERLSRSFPTV